MRRPTCSSTSRCSTTGVAATPRWATARRFGSSRTGSASMRLSNPRRHKSGPLEDEIRWAPQLVASPEFVRTRSIAAPEDLLGLPSMQWHVPGRAFVWALADPRGRNVAVSHQPRLVTDDQIALRAAAVQGLGLVQLPSMSVENEVHSGVLTRLLPDWTLPMGIVHAVFASRRGLLPRVRHLIEFLANEFAAVDGTTRSEEHTSELQSPLNLV